MLVKHPLAAHVPMPVDAAGHGPVRVVEAAKILHQVWDLADNSTLCTAKDRATAEAIACALRGELAAEPVATAYYDGFCDGIMRRPWEAAADYAAVMGQAYAKTGERPQPFIPVTGPGPDEWHELRRLVLVARRLMRIEWRTALLSLAVWMDWLPPLQWFGRRAALKRRSDALINAEQALNEALSIANDIDRATRGAITAPATGQEPR